MIRMVHCLAVRSRHLQQQPPLPLLARLLSLGRSVGREGGRRDTRPQLCAVAGCLTRRLCGLTFDLAGSLSAHRTGDAIGSAQPHAHERVLLQPGIGHWHCLPNVMRSVCRVVPRHKADHSALACSRCLTRLTAGARSRLFGRLFQRLRESLNAAQTLARECAFVLFRVLPAVCTPAKTWAAFRSDATLSLRADRTRDRRGPSAPQRTRIPVRGGQQRVEQEL
jgi:hypothetical protein